MGAAHRDITPNNVYVANRAVLKLGDFGITKTRLKRSGVPADLANWSYAPRDLGAYWRTADDVYKVGLLMLTLHSGEEVTNSVGAVAVNPLTTRGYGLREAIKKAISVKAQRPQTATDLAQLLPNSKGAS